MSGYRPASVQVTDSDRREKGKGAMVATGFAGLCPRSDESDISDIDGH